MAVLTSTMYALRGRRLFPGFLLVLPTISYGTVRFGLDFLRTMDRRYAGLTPAQYGSTALVASRIGLSIYFKRRAAVRKPAEAPAGFERV